MSDLVRPVGLPGRPLGVIPRRLLETVEFLLYTLPFFAHKRSFARVYSVRSRGFCGKMTPVKSQSARAPSHRNGQERRYTFPCIRNPVLLIIFLCALLRPAQAPTAGATQILQIAALTLSVTLSEKRSNGGLCSTAGRESHGASNRQSAGNARFPALNSQWDSRAMNMSSKQ